MLKRITLSLWKGLSALVLMVISQTSYSVGEGGTPVEFSGTVYDPPSCTINNGLLIETDFERVPITQADGKQILKTVEHNMTCSAEAANTLLKMQISGTPGFAADVLATNLDGLGIRFYHDGQVVTLKSWFNLPQPASKLVLTASPIIKPGSQPEAKAFSASATLMMDFQ